MDTLTLHCDVCFINNFQNTKLNFYFGFQTTCFQHIHCQKCAGPKCKICGSSVKMMLINDKMPTRFYRKFINIKELKQELQKSIRFQFQNIVSLEKLWFQSKYCKFFKCYKNNLKQKYQLEKVWTVKKLEKDRIEKLIAYIKFIKDKSRMYQYKRFGVANKKYLKKFKN